MPNNHQGCAIAQTAGTFLAGARCVFDYEHQAWTVAGKYIRCGHPDSMQCQCYGKLHAGERATLPR